MQVYVYIVTTLASISNEKIMQFLKIQLNNEHHNQYQLYIFLKVFYLVRTLFCFKITNILPRTNEND